MKNILLAHDFSENAGNALQYCIEWSQHQKLHISILHVYERPIVGFEVGLSSDAELEDPVKKEADHYLQKKIGQLQSQGIDADHILVPGDPSHMIPRICNEGKFDLLVMGMTSKSPLESLLIGATLNKIIDDLKVPMLVIPGTFKFKPFEKILYASDNQESDFNHLQFLNEWKNTFQLKLNAIHYMEDIEELDDDMLNRFEPALKNALPDIEIETINKVSHDVEFSIHRYLRNNRIHLLILMHRQMGFWDSLFHKSYSKSLANDLHVPVMIVH